MKEVLGILHLGRRMPRAGWHGGDGTGLEEPVAVTGLVAAGGGELLWEVDCSGLQGLGDVWKMAMEDFFPHLVDLRILILIYGLRFHGFRGASSAALQRGSSAGEGPQGPLPTAGCSGRSRSAPVPVPPSRGVSRASPTLSCT